MCGVAGVMTLDGAPPEESVLDALAEALAHRGPDGRGRHVEGGVGLVQTRLAIIDLEGGDQPLFAPMPDGRRAALVANGEIYNYRELRADLGEEAFATHSDCEPPLHLYLRHGLDFARTLRGMYAIAVHDPAEGRLVLARDPFGIKPLYFVEGHFGFAFASEPQALVQAGLTGRGEERRRRDELLQLQFATGRETIFPGVKRVLPGETLVVEAGRVTGMRHLHALPSTPPNDLSEDAALADLDRAFEQSVDLHQRSDVPYGMFLSGGVDSSAVLAMMARLNDRPVLAFTAGFAGAGVHDERDHARVVAKAAGAEHVEVDFGEDDFWSLLPGVAAAMDDPVADYACLPTFKLARAVRDAGLKVVLSGEGGDELFAGYGRYRRAARPWWLGGRPMRAKGMFDGLGVLRDEGRGWREGLAKAEAEVPDGLTALQKVQAVDCADWLPHDLLIKVDRCLMAHGVEGRVPFLDPELGRFAFSLPDGLKTRGRKGKWLLRRWLDIYLPESKPFEPKRGFTVPVGEWISRRAQTLAPLVAAQAGVQEACVPGAVERLFAANDAKAGKAAWTLLFYALWHRAHVEGGTPDGDAEAVLAQKP